MLSFRRGKPGDSISNCNMGRPKCDVCGKQQHADNKIHGWKCPGAPGHEGQCGEPRCRDCCKCGRQGWWSQATHTSGGSSGSAVRKSKKEPGSHFKEEPQEPASSSSSAPRWTESAQVNPEVASGTLGEGMRRSRNAAIEDELSIVTVNVDGYMRPSALTPADAKNTPQKKTWSPWRGARCAAKSAASPVSRALEPAACARAAAHDAGSEAGGRWKRARLGIACVTLPAWAIHHAKEPGDCTVPNPIGSVPLQGKYLRQIFQGHKLYEGRPLNSRGFRRIQHDSWFGFHCYQSWHVVVKVTDIREYADVRSMLTELGCR